MESELENQTVGHGEMTTSTPKTATETAPTSELCASCPHPLADHDALGLRYCTASGVSGLSRGCICGK
jgi:hypothetical protein